MEIYGHNHLSLFFVPLLEMHDDGFVFRKKFYSWTDVKHVLVWEPLKDFGAILGTAAIPRATIILSDEKKIRIHSAVFVKKGEKAHVGFFSGKSDAFEKLIDLFKSKIA